MNITVRVASAKALAQLKAVQGQVNATNASLARGAVVTQNYNRALALAPLVKYGNQIQWVGRQLQYNFTLPILIAGGAAAKFALDNEKAFTRIAKVYGDLGMDARILKNELAELEDAFVALSNHYGVQQKEVLNIAADWAAAGASGVALAKGVEQTLVTMVLGELEATEATKALIAIQAQYRISTKELADTIGILNIIENQTGASLQDLVVGLSRAAGASRNAGIDIRHLSAMMAALVPAAGSASTAGNGLRTIISRLMAPTLDATGLLRAMGIETSEMAWKSLNAVDRIDLLAEAFGKLPQAQKAAVSATLGSRFQLNRFDVLLEAVNKNHSYYHRALDATSNRVEYMRQAQKELNTVLESNPQRLKQIWVMLQNAMADVIQPMIPVILMAAAALKDLFTGFANLPPELQKAITLGFLFLALLGPLIRYIGSTMALIGILGVGTHALTRRFFQLTGILATFIKLPFQAVFAVLTTLIGATVGFVGATTGAAVGIVRTGMSVIAGTLAPYISFVATAIFGTLRIQLAAAAAFIVQWVSATATVVLAHGMRSVFAALMAPYIAAAARIPAALVTLHAWVYVWLLQFAAMFRTAVAAIMTAWTLLPTAIAAVMRNVWGVLMISGGVSAIVARTWLAFTVSLAFMFQRMAITITGIWTAMHAGLIAIMASARTAILSAWVFLQVSLVATWTATMAAIRGAWVATLLFLSSPRLIVAAVARIGAVIAAGFAAVGSAVSLPIVLAVTAAFAAALGLAYAFRDQLARIWAQVRDVTIDAFNALPSAVASAMMAVVDIVYRAAMAVYELFSYLNPFASHSPSLVQNVTNGMKVIRRQFATVTQISGPINKAYADIKKFSQATAEFRKGMDSIARAEDLKNLRIVAPGAVDEFKALVSDLQRLRKIEAKLANTPGMKKMENQIFKNEQAQKRLRLEILKMGDGADVDKLRQKFADLQGQIEMLSGQRASLRAAGAGGDITGWYDQQIAALESQQKALQKQSAPVQKLQDELEELQRQGEILSLEESLKFDPVRRQADEVASAIRDVEAALRDMTSAADEAVRRREAAKKAGSDAVGAGTQAFLDAAGGDFPIPGGTGKDIGREFPNIKDQSALIDQFTRDLAERTSGMFDKFDVFGPLKKKWNQFTGWLDENIGQKIPVWKDKISGIFGGIGFNTESLQVAVEWISRVVNKIIGWGESLWRLFGEDIKKIFEDTWNALKDALDTIGPEVEKFKDLWEPLVELWKLLWPIIKVVAAVLGAVLLLALKVVSNIIANVLGPALELIVDVLAAVIRIIRGVAEIILGVFTRDIGLVWKGITDLFGGFGDLIAGLIEGAAKIIWGAVSGLVEGVVDFFIWLWDELIGNSIIPDMWDEIIDYFKDIPKKVWKALSGLAKKLWDRAVEAMNSFWDGVKRRWENIKGWFGEIAGKIKNAIGNALTTLYNIGSQLIRGMFDGVRYRWDIAKEWFGTIKDKILNNMGDPLTMLYNAGKAIVRGLIQGIRAMGDKLGDAAEWVAGIIGRAVPGSPVKSGPLTVLNNGYAGKQIVKMLADGVIAGSPQLTSAAQTALRATNNVLSTSRLTVPGFGLQSTLAASVAPVVTAAMTRANAAERYAGTSATQSNNGGETHLHLYGDLVFPEIKDGDDAKKFIENLENLAG